MQIDPADRGGVSIYRLMSGLIVPRPIAFISTVDRHGTRNLAPFSYSMAVTESPPVHAVSISGKATGYKDTLNNIREMGEYVVNVVSEEIGAAMNETAADCPPEIDEFEVAGLTAAPSDRISAPRVAESPASLECRLLEIRQFGDPADGASVVFGEIVLFHIRDDLLDAEGYVDLLNLRPLGRLSGSLYCRTTDHLSYTRPGAGG